MAWGNFQVPTIHGAVPRVDATTASNKEAHELGDAGHHEQTGQFLLPKTVSPVVWKGYLSSRSSAKLVFIYLE